MARGATREIRLVLSRRLALMARDTLIVKSVHISQGSVIELDLRILFGHHRLVAFAARYCAVRGVLSDVTLVARGIPAQRLLVERVIKNGGRQIHITVTLPTGSGSAVEFLQMIV